MSTSIEHLRMFQTKIKTGEPFSVIRPADGEYHVMNRIPVQTIDKWAANEKVSSDLYASVHKASQQENMYVGIPCPDCQGRAMYDYYTSTFNIKNVTYANVFNNAQWKPFIEDIPDFYYIGPGTLENERVRDRFTINEFLANNWDGTVLDEITSWVRERNGLFLVSAGPLAKIIVPHLHEHCPGNQYLDVGSALDTLLKSNPNTRPYVHGGTKDSCTVCSHDYGHNPITCILTVYKRPHCLHEQLHAVRNQTVPPNKIIIWVNGTTLPDGDYDDVTVVHSNENFGVWARFTVALMVKTEFVCIFDDDTIPGKKWFENCLQTMNQVNGLLGTIGVVFQNSMDTYLIDKRHGWDAPNESTQKVDIVGHSWFFKREWLHYLWKYYDSNEMFIAGEDIAFSCALQKEGIDTFVPPHPMSDPEMFGSQKGWEYGADSVAISHQSESGERFNKAFEIIRKKHGFRIINDIYFNGGWSYTQNEMNELFKYTRKGMNILEFGAGDSTLKILKLLEPENYYVYETDLSYVPKSEKIKTVLYDPNNIENLEIQHDILFDLVLVDGPNGENRKHWFSKLRSCTHPGTIILIDDFNHYECFGQELDKYFDYELLSFSNVPFVPYGEHSWKIVRITSQYRFGIVDNTPRYGSYVIPDTIEKKVLVDIGSNIGTFTLQNLSAFEKIYCFEACYENYLKCKENLKQYAHIEIFNLAVSDMSNKRVHIRKHKSEDHGSCSVIDHYDWTDVKHPVQTISLEDILSMVGGRVNYMKVDIECGEYDFLMNKDLSKIDCLSIELHGQLGDKRSELMRHIEKYFSIVHKHLWDHYEITYLKKQNSIAVVYGTRPEFLKLKVLIDTLKPLVIRVNQHPDYTEDEGYPDYIIDVKTGDQRLECIGSSILDQLPALIKDCTYVIAQGDTATCFYTLLTAYQMKKRCVHIEAGMRTYDLNNPWPEESYRQMISRITSIHFCPSRLEAHTLGVEQTSGEVHIIGNPLLDLVRSYGIHVTHEKRVLVTLHRRENWDKYIELIQQLDTLASVHPEYEFVFLTHPNPALKTLVHEHGKHLKVSEPVSHRRMIEILSSCACVITDSGGIQEEANFLGKHMYVLRECTERKMIPSSRCVVNPETIDIIGAPSHEPGLEYGDGHAVEKITEYFKIPWYYFYTPDYENWHSHLHGTLNQRFVVNPICLATIEGLNDQHPVHHWVGCSAKVKLVVNAIRENMGRRIVFSDVTWYVNPHKIHELYNLVTNAPKGMTFARNGGLDEINIGFMVIDCDEKTLALWQTCLDTLGPKDHDQYRISCLVDKPNFFPLKKVVARWPVDIETWKTHFKSEFLMLKIFTWADDTKVNRDSFRYKSMKDYGYMDQNDRIS